MFRCFSVPVAPALIGLILGPMAELQLRRALAMSQGDPGILVSTPLSVALLLTALLLLLLPLWRALRKA
jgi:putative tricarboxylic transport membrane protein